MAKMNRLDRRGSGPWFVVALIVLVFSLYSVAIAWATVNDCDDYPGKSWTVWPPGWECTGSPGFG